MKGITELAMASLGKELVFDGRMQAEEVKREKKVETHNALTVELVKEKLVRILFQDNLKKLEANSEE